MFLGTTNLYRVRSTARSPAVFPRFSAQQACQQRIRVFLTIHSSPSSGAHPFQRSITPEGNAVVSSTQSHLERNSASPCIAVLGLQELEISPRILSSFGSTLLLFFTEPWPSRPTLLRRFGTLHSSPAPLYVTWHQEKTSHIEKRRCCSISSKSGATLWHITCGPVELLALY